jgi:hypothetical protein
MAPITAAILTLVNGRLPFDKLRANGLRQAQPERLGSKPYRHQNDDSYRSITMGFSHPIPSLWLRRGAGGQDVILNKSTQAMVKGVPSLGREVVVVGIGHQPEFLGGGGSVVEDFAHGGGHRGID